MLLTIAIPLEGWLIFNQKVLFIILWLAVINTTVAWLFLGESLTLKELFGIAIVIIGVTLVQAKRINLKSNNQPIETPTGKNAIG